MNREQSWKKSFVAIWILPLFYLSGCQDLEQPQSCRLIQRDAETQRSIERTAGVKLRRLPEAAATRLVVQKSRYRLDVYQPGNIQKTFPIALGGQPGGAKTREGDQRTPEGRYVMLPHWSSPKFGACFNISYPNRQDAQKALGEGRIEKTDHDRITQALQGGGPSPNDTALGGLILLHGSPRFKDLPLTMYNWTNGCVAMENHHLAELLKLFRKEDRPEIEIRP